ncbi:MAG: glycosyltransferase family 39 protein [Planctomycetota bacterium]
MESADDAAASGVRGMGRPLLLLLVIHLLVWTVVPAVVNQNLPLDVVEAIAWGAEWEWGYDKHPPLSGWMAAGAGWVGRAVADATGLGTGDWALYLLSQVCVVAAMLGVYLLGRETLGAGGGGRRAVLAVLLMQGVTYHHFTSPEFNVNVAQLPFWAFAFYLYWLALRDDRLWQWGGIGLCVGLAVLSKYLGGLIVFPLLLFPLVSREHRWVLRKPGMYVSAGVCLLVVLPHLWWASQNQWMTLTYGLDRAGADEPWSLLDHVVHPIDFVLAQALAALATVPIVWAWGIRRRGKGDATQAVAGADEVAGVPHASRFLLVMAATPMGVFCGLSLVAGFELRSMWGTPLLLLLGAVLADRFRFTRVGDAKRLVLPPLIVCVVLAGVYAGTTLTSVAVRDKGKRTNFDGVAFSQALESAWRERTDRPLTIVAGRVWESCNPAWYLPQRPTAYLYADPLRAPWVDDAAMRERGGLIVWTKARRADADPATHVPCPYEGLAERFPAHAVLEDVVVPWPGDPEAAGGGMRFGVVYVPPR